MENPITITQDPNFLKILEISKKLAAGPIPILIMGETGVGKELLSKFIHDNSQRSKAPFVTVNCAAIPNELIESEFFGHEKGSFTGAYNKSAGIFEAGNTGTIFLDEVSNMSQQLQSKLLRVLQDGHYKPVGSRYVQKSDFRLISASNVSLKENGFKKDLLYRINTSVIEIPPLRKRRGDIELLINYFIPNICTRFGLPLKTISKNALQVLLNYNYPGNVRELKSILENSVLLSDSKIEEIYFNSDISQVDFTYKLFDYKKMKAEEKDIILRVLAECGWNQRKAAEKFHISARKMNYRIKIHGIKYPGWSANA